MPEKLTKIMIAEGRECVACVNCGTDKCHIHNGVPDCVHCEMIAMILNKLYQYEHANS